MKTISELNERWWYRLLKVLYIGVGIFLYSMSLMVISLSFITIEDNKEEFFFNQTINEEKIQLITDLKSKEYTTVEITDALKKKYHGQYEKLELTREQFKSIYGESALDGYDLPEQKEAKPETPGTLNWLFLIVPGSLFIAWLILQFIQRTFYYIVLGKINPDK